MNPREVSKQRELGQQYGLYGPLAIFSGTSNPSLAEEVAARLNRRLGKTTIWQYANGNIFAKLNESVRSKDVFIIQPTCAGVRNRKKSTGECVFLREALRNLDPDEYEQVPTSVNDNIMELMVLVDTLRRDSAGRITAVIPYFAYGRTDKKDQPRVPITARLMADVIGIAGANRFLVMDLHAGQIQGFFDIPGDELTAQHMLVDYFRERQVPNAVVVAPDIGASRRARNFAEELNLPLAIIEKRRMQDGSGTRQLNLIGTVDGSNAIIFDDEIDTGGTIAHAAHYLRERGAQVLGHVLDALAGKGADVHAELDHAGDHVGLHHPGAAGVRRERGVGARMQVGSGAGVGHGGQEGADVPDATHEAQQHSAPLREALGGYREHGWP